tara:strand:+ start:2206 stop:2409 length:204 start_codon:yes stop_codon:yes gene_type:complete
MTARIAKLRQKLELAEAEEKVIEAASLFFHAVNRMNVDQFIMRGACQEARDMEDAIERLDKIKGRKK